MLTSDGDGRIKKGIALIELEKSRSNGQMLGMRDVKQDDDDSDK